MSTVSPEWLKVQPHFRGNRRLYARFRRLVRLLSLIDCGPEDFPFAVQDFRRRALNSLIGNLAADTAEMRVAFSVLVDLFAQGWSIRVENDEIYCARPLANLDAASEKNRVRSGLMIARDEQLREPSVRAFIQAMERSRLYEGKWVSIFSLMRDGIELAANLDAALDCDPQTGEKAYAQVIQPYLAFADEGSMCPFTGLRLLDIWRYFRHTWLTPFRSTPGRTMPILIRDAAAVNHPIIGIAALSSSIVQQSERDKWIGWRGEDVLQELDEQPTLENAEWLLGKLSDLIDSVYIGDLLKERAIRSVDIKAPEWSIVEKLRALGEERRDAHKMQPPGTRSKHGLAGDWLNEAQTDLFTFKRASTLADLLEVRMAFNQAGLVYPEASSLKDALQSDDFRVAVAKLVRRIKGNNVGINMMDISVAGAVEPYRAILGGKLVSMLLCSPEVVQEYEARYSKQPSVIASAMRGRAVYKTPSLVLLCTTGLFGSGSSQYNRISIPAGPSRIRFVKLDQRTEFGTFHFSQTTMAEMKRLSELDFQGTITNGIFGEGVNPKMRKIRESLDRVGLPANELLKHSTPRAVYAIALCKNYRNLLLGRETEPEYFFPKSLGLSGTHEITEAWITRWLVPRVSNPDALAQVRANASAFPYTHGARVSLPEIAEEQISLFHDDDDEDY